MNLSFDKFVLQTQSIESLAQFITQLFDVEPSIDAFGQSFFNIGGICLLLKKSEKNFSKDCNIGLIFQVDSVEIIEQFQMKLQFYYYREKLENSSQVTTESNRYRLSFNDPDNRLWIIESPNYVSSHAPM